MVVTSLTGQRPGDISSRFCGKQNRQVGPSPFMIKTGILSQTVVFF